MEEMAQWHEGLGDKVVFKNTVNIILEARKKFNFAWLIRLLSMVFVAVYVLFFYQGTFPWRVVSREYFIKISFFYLAIGLICNGGLFFITIQYAKKAKVLATLFYIPTFLITPWVVGSLATLFYPSTFTSTPLILGSIKPYYMGVFVVFTGAAFVYYRFCPWRNN